MHAGEAGASLGVQESNNNERADTDLIVNRRALMLKALSVPVLFGVSEVAGSPKDRIQQCAEALADAMRDAYGGDWRVSIRPDGSYAAVSRLLF